MLTDANVCGHMRTYADCLPPVGGWNGEEIESTCEKYYPERDEWVEISEVFNTAFLLLADFYYSAYKY